LGRHSTSVHVAMKNHSNVHLRKWEFKCDDCDKAYSRKDKLTSHKCAKSNLKRHSNRPNIVQKHNHSIHKKIKSQRCQEILETKDIEIKEESLDDVSAAVHKNDLHALMKKSQKDQMFVSVEKPEACSSAGQNDQKCFVQVNVNVNEEILETKDIEIKEESLDDLDALTIKCEPNLPKTYDSADQNDQKNFVQVNVIEEILETKEVDIEIKEELDVDPDDPLAGFVKQEPFKDDLEQPNQQPQHQQQHQQQQQHQHQQQQQQKQQQQHQQEQQQQEHQQQQQQLEGNEWQLAADDMHRPDHGLKKCVLCDFTTHKMQQLMQHLKTHKQCHQCDQKFGGLGATQKLKRHALKVHNPPPPPTQYECPHCGKTFPYKSYFERHSQTCRKRSQYDF
jgi:hypothetical protein